MIHSLRDKTLFITGASRGIGLAIAEAAAREGANVAIAAKTVDPHKHLPGTIFSAAEAVEKAGGKTLAIQMDVRDEGQVTEAVRRIVETFGGLDICVNKASAIDQATTLETELKGFDLLHDVIARGTFMVSKTCLPHLLEALNPHILMLTSPPVMDRKKLARSLHNTIAKYTAAMCVIGMAEGFRDRGVAVNALQPRTWIGTSAIRFRRGEEAMRHCRTPEIMAKPPARSSAGPRATIPASSRSTTLSSTRRASAISRNIASIRASRCTFPGPCSTRRSRPMSGVSSRRRVRWARMRAASSSRRARHERHRPLSRRARCLDRLAQPAGAAQCAR
ncbi:MAG: SDR family oxidoreductase [Sphingomonadaceae bacterium]|nr:SDR family oxidoreductase [Sphingomonadaceae bacterium]